MSHLRNTLAEAANFDCEIFAGDDTYLQLDLDRDRAPVRFCDRETQKMVWEILVNWGWVVGEGPEEGREDGREGVLVTESKSGGQHKYVRLGPRLTGEMATVVSLMDSGPNALLRVALQAILGSDPVRELYNLRRLVNRMRGDLRQGRVGPAVGLFETEQEAVKVEKWLGQPPVENRYLAARRLERRQRLLKSVQYIRDRAQYLREMEANEQKQVAVMSRLFGGSKW